MALHHAREEEGFFFACEQRTRRNLNTPNYRIFSSSNALTLGSDSLTNKTISFFYDFFSNYGRSIFWPFFYWILQLFVFLGGYLCMADKLSTQSEWTNNSSTIKATLFSLQSSINPFSAFAKSSVIVGNSLAVILTSIAQGLFSFTLIALIIIAIRRNFYKGGD